jgi:hypothetical protein
MNPNKKVLFTVLSFVLAMLVIACSCSSLIPTATTPQPPAGGGGNTQPTVGGGSNGQQILFQDDFSNTNSGWDQAHTDIGSTDYENGGYRINVIQSDAYFFANPYQSFQNDVRIEVDATKIGGPDDNAFGVICRYQDMDNYYYFYISSDGYVGIGMNIAGMRTIISDSSGNLTSDSSINQGAASNHLRADCIGNTLTLFVNGTQVATATDSSFTTGGDVGLIATTYKVDGTDIMFDNLFVYKP